MPKRDFLAGVIALSQEDPKRHLSLIREGWPEIKAAIEHGHTLKVIHQRLERGGVPITYRSFTRYVRRLRKEFAIAKAGEPRPTVEDGARTAASATEPQPPPTQEDPFHDPYATIRERLNGKPSGFHWDEDDHDADKLLQNQNRKDEI